MAAMSATTEECALTAPVIAHPKLLEPTVNTSLVRLPCINWHKLFPMQEVHLLFICHLV